MTNELVNRLTEQVIDSISIEEAWQTVNTDFDDVMRKEGRVVNSRPFPDNYPIKDNFRDIETKVRQESQRLYPEKKMIFIKGGDHGVNAVWVYVKSAIHAVRYYPEEAERCLAMTSEQITELAEKRDHVAVLLKQVVLALNWRK
jgi:hypothetical protein